LLVQQNVDASDFFNRSWEEFKVGFKDTRGNYWLGNELLHQLTSNGRYTLRFDLQAVNGSWFYAEYHSVVVFNESSNYMIQVFSYSGNAGDAFTYHDRMMFTTYDRDNDHFYTIVAPYNTSNCAVHNSAGFWYAGTSHCARASLNGLRGHGNGFNWIAGARGANMYLKTSRMWLTC